MTKTAPWAVVALTAMMATPAVAQQKPNSAESDAAHVRALIQQAMQQVQPQTPAAPTGTPYTTPGTASGIVDPGSGSARAGEEHRHCRRPDHAAPQRFHDPRTRSQLPRQSDVGSGKHAGTTDSSAADHPGHHDSADHEHARKLERRHRAESVERRRQLHAGLDQQPVRTIRARSIFEIRSGSRV